MISISTLRLARCSPSDVEGLFSVPEDEAMNPICLKTIALSILPTLIIYKWKTPPSSRSWTSDLRITAIINLQSSALPTELSKGGSPVPSFRFFMGTQTGVWPNSVWQNFTIMNWTWKTTTCISYIQCVFKRNIFITNLLLIYLMSLKNHYTLWTWPPLG